MEAAGATRTEIDVVNLHPDFYNMTFTLKPGVPTNGGAVGTLKPVTVYLHNGEVFAVCINSAGGGLTDVQMTWLSVAPPNAT